MARKTNFPSLRFFEQPGFTLGSASARQFASAQIQSLQDEEGIVKQVRSPWNDERLVLALSGQNAVGLDHVRELLDQDLLFYQLEGDTVLISARPRCLQHHRFERSQTTKDFPRSPSR